MTTIKSLLLAAFVLIGISFSYGQETEEMRYLLGNENGKVNVSGFGSYIIGFSSLDGSAAVYNGGGGAVLLNQTMYFGAYGLGLSTRHNNESLTMVDRDGETVTYNDLNTNFGHGGFWVGYLHKSYKPVHFGASTKLGWGALSMSNDTFTNNYGDYNYYQVASDNVFVIIPQLEVEMNLLRWFKINASAGYQFVTGVDKTYTNTSGDKIQFFDAADYNKPMFNLSFVFGGFGGKR